MKKLFLAACLLCAGSLLAGPLPKELYKDLTPGPYLVRIKGMLTRACARAIQAELSKHPMIAKAEADFDKESATFTVKADGRLTLRELQGILNRAAKKMKLSRYEIADIRYMPSSK